MRIDILLMILWVLQNLDDNPMAWIIQYNGFMVDARSLPRNVQVVAYEKGIIPYIPADRISH